jgi:peptide-methionine (S)-S-oxide reductase
LNIAGILPAHEVLLQMRKSIQFFFMLTLLILPLNLVAAQGSSGASNRAKATFAGGCFWCMEPAFDKVDGVIATISGYIGGQKKNPTYDEVSAGGTGHAEAVEIIYDPSKVTYEKLLQIFWHNIDPTVADRQFCDVGSQYRSAIFYHDAKQKQLAEESKRAIEKSGEIKQPILTQIVPAGEFTQAEEYHQDFYKKNTVRYNAYRLGCRRDTRLKELWGPSAGH